MKNRFLKYKKILLGVIIGLILGTIITCGATSLISASEIRYNNSKANLLINNASVSNIQDAIDAIHTKISSKSAPAVCKTGYTMGTDYGEHYDCIPETKIVPQGYTCIRAEWLHSDICTQSSNYCYRDGYNTTGIMGTNIVYFGKLGRQGADLQTGDALDCDVNGNGYIDIDDKGRSTERFYYVSPRWTPGTDVSESSFNSDIAVLIYYSSTYNGVPSTTGASYATQSDIQAAYPDETITTYDNWHGPVTAIKHLPKTIANGGTWQDFIVKDNNNESKRAIIACSWSGCSNPQTYTSGGNLPHAFSYEGYAARLLTVPEIEKAGCDTLSGVSGLSSNSSLRACNFLLEGTNYTNSKYLRASPMFENPGSGYTNAMGYANTTGVNYSVVTVYSDSANPYTSVRPTIEVSVSQILK